MSSTFDRNAALSIVASALADAIARAYVDALAGWAPAPGVGVHN